MFETSRNDKEKGGLNFINTLTFKKLAMSNNQELLYIFIN